jgi:hypothetical protein
MRDPRYKLCLMVWLHPSSNLLAKSLASQENFEQLAKMVRTARGPVLIAAATLSLQEHDVQSYPNEATVPASCIGHAVYP